MPYDPSLPLPEERARHFGVGWNRAFTPVFTVARQALLFRIKIILFRIKIIPLRIRTVPFRIRIILFRIRTLLFPVNGPLESSHLELFRSLGGNTLAIPVEIPTGEVALRLREKGARVFNLWAWE